jgi:Ca-activated chloride channel family protein
MKVFDTLRKLRVTMLILAGLCLSYGIYQKYWYSDLVRKAVENIEANRLDQQYLEEAKKGLFSSDGLIAYNMGVRAYRANNLKKAGEHFYEVIRNSHDSSKKKQAHYNLGNIFVELELPQKAAEMYKESLRLDPKDWESKYNLERLYAFYLEAFPGQGNQASLPQEPGEKGSDQNQMGSPGAKKPDI